MNTILRISAVILLLPLGCATRPPAPPPGSVVPLPWGAIDVLDVDATDDATTSLVADIGGNADFALLALAGAGSHTAFGAGVMCGWTVSGTRPSFKVVTATSTSAILGVFAFLGPEHDETIKTLFTTLYTRDIYRRVGFIASYSTGAVNDPGPLRDLLATHIDAAVLDAIAAEHARGRRLYLTTTNLDTADLTVWDMGAIASSDRADRLDRFHEVVIAACSWPPLLPPVYMPVEVGDETYWHMHLDGSLETPVLARAFMIDVERALEHAGVDDVGPQPVLYVLVNAELSDDVQYPTPVEPSLRHLANAAFILLTDESRDGSIYRTYVLARRYGIGFRFLSIPDEYDSLPQVEIFNPDAMLPLFELGFEIGLNPQRWQIEPPDLDPEELMEDILRAR